MGYKVLLLMCALLAGMGVVQLDLPSTAVAWLIIWPMGTVVWYVFLGCVYITCFEWWLKEIYPSMKVKGDRL